MPVKREKPNSEAYEENRLGMVGAIFELFPVWVSRSHFVGLAYRNCNIQHLPRSACEREITT